MKRSLAWGVAGLGLAAGACAGGGPEAGPGLAVSVAPLELPGATDACYQLKVWNAEDPDQGEVLWEQVALCSSRYGANNGIRFTGLCDAQAGTDDDAVDNDGKNAIRLVLNDIYKNGDAESGTALMEGEDYINPCPPPTEGEDNGCVLVADCQPNQDTKVEFNLTVMRQAEAGFFDTVVKLEDIFCAAKLDCEDQDQDVLTYLHDPSRDADGPTAVLAFTCVGGSSDLFMYLDDIVVECEGGATTRTATIDPSEGQGNIGHIESDGAAPILFGAAVNTGEGFQGSRYWNVLLGTNFARAGETCTLHARGTASKVELDGPPFETPAHTRYPYIAWDVELSAAGARTCSRHALNGGEVETRYSAIDTPTLLAHSLEFPVNGCGDGLLDLAIEVCDNGAANCNGAGCHCNTNCQRIGVLAPPGAGLGLDFDGGHYVLTGGTGVAGRGARTISVWVRSDDPSASPQELLSYSPGPSVGAAGQWFRIGINGYAWAGNGGESGVYLDGGNGFYFWQSATINDGQWHQITVVMPKDSDLAGLSVYVDGSALPVRNPWGNVVIDTAVGASHLALGYSQDPSLWFRETMADVTIWDVALSPAEVALVANTEGAGVDLSSTWTPRFDRIIERWRLTDVGNVMIDGTAVPAAIGQAGQITH